MPNYIKSYAWRVFFNYTQEVVWATSINICYSLVVLQFVLLTFNNLPKSHTPKKECHPSVGLSKSMDAWSYKTLQLYAWTYRSGPRDCKRLSWFTFYRAFFWLLKQDINQFEQLNWHFWFIWHRVLFYDILKQSCDCLLYTKNITNHVLFIR